MNIEKEKEIKKALEFQRDGLMYLENNCVEIVYCKDILTLINELESELEKEQINNLNCDTELQYKEKRIAELENLCNKTYEDLTKEIDRLEKENERLKNRITCQVVIPDGKLEQIKKECLEKVEFDAQNILKQFAERLKEKMGVREYMGVKYKQGVFSENEIDETLKEFLDTTV